MQYLALRRQLQAQPFFSLDTARLIEPNFSRIQLTRWQQKGYIKPIIRGWYVFHDVTITEDLLMLLANKLVPHSYISLASALSLYNLIPEGVFQITSVTTKKTQQFDSSLGVFNYRHVKPLLMFGYTLLRKPYGSICIAELEKAILDFLYLTPQANHVDYFNEMRLNKERLLLLDQNKLRKYLAIFNQKALATRVERLLEYAAY